MLDRAQNLLGAGRLGPAEVLLTRIRQVSSSRVTDVLLESISSSVAPPTLARGRSPAVAHALLTTGYILLWTGKKYSDLGEDYFDRLNRDRLTRRLVKRLEKSGHQVSLQPAA